MNFFELKTHTVNIMRLNLRKLNTFPIIVTALLFVLMFPLVRQVNFPQNDDWVYYNAVSAFRNGNFTLNPIVAPTFYMQGYTGAIFSILFGMANLPVLTLLVSVLNFLIFFKILSKHFQLRNLDSLLFSLLFFFNPLHIYSSLGFMTENYFLFFTLLSILFILHFDTGNKRSKFILANVFILLSFFVRQLGMVTSLAFCVYLVFKKKYIAGFLEFLVFLSIAVYYLILFPRTNEMVTKSLQLSHLLDVKYFYSLFYTMLIYVAAFTFPLVLSLVFNRGFLNSKKRLAVFFVVSVAFIHLLNKFFVAQEMAWSEFPYLDNVWERRGFFPRGIEGNKYYFHWIYYLYKYWDVLAKVGVSLSISFLLFAKKRAINFYSIFIFLYMLVMIITEKVYDRYLLVLVPLAILFCLSLLEKINLRARLLTIFSVTFFMFYSYQFSMDFVLLNKYVWNRSLQLVSEKLVTPSKILGTNPWKLSYQNPTKNYDYIFMFDTLKTRPEAACCWRLMETRTIDFPLNFFIDAKIYLYEKKN